MRQEMVWLLNIFIPGAGLIVRRREWLGLALAILFGICGHVAIAGVLIAPVAVPRGLTALAVILAAITWLMAQWLFRRQSLVNRRRAGLLKPILKDAAVAMEAGKLETARDYLESGLALDDENVDLHAMSARLLDRQGLKRKALKAWRRVVKVDAQHRYRVEALAALADDNRPSQPDTAAVRDPLTERP